MTTALSLNPAVVTSYSYEFAYDLSHANTMALACVADKAVALYNEAQLDTFMADYNKQDDNRLPLLVLSGGSNVLLPSELNAIVLRPIMRGIKIINDTVDYVDIEVMAGENWHDLVTYTVSQGWYGLENLALIPGLTGAAPIQNIGAYGVQLEDSLLSVRAYHIPTQTWHELSRQDCEFGYRDSLFKRQPNTWLISRVSFRLHMDENQISANYGDVQAVALSFAQQDKRLSPTPSDVMQAIVHIRKQKIPNPKILANCGSFFQNPIITGEQFTTLQASYPDIVGYSMPEQKVKVAAGWLIEHAGLKGGGIAPIVTHQQQALVLTNHQPYQATQADVAKAQDFIIRQVYDKFAITLTREPIWLNTNGSIGQSTYAD